MLKKFQELDGSETISKYEDLKKTVESVSIQAETEIQRI